MRLTTEARHQVFLAAKEALNNALKHAQATTVTVRLRVAPAAIEIEIEDDGVGFEPAPARSRAGGGHGLGNMRERMRLASGLLELCSAPRQGTRVTFRLPSAATRGA